MENRPIIFLDSGVGGLPYLGSFRDLNDHESLLYLADRLNFPYGPKPKELLVALLVDLVVRLRSAFDPKLLVVACNTASVSALDELRKAFPDLPFVGTVPAVKPAVLSSKTRCIGVLATERTIADPYTENLAHQYGRDCRVLGIGAPELVEFVEHRYLSAEEAERSAVVQPYVDRFRRGGADAIVLGCTHFLFLTDHFSQAAAPDLRVYDSLDGVAHRIHALLCDRSLLSDGPPVPPRFFVTGREEIPASLGAFARRFGMTAELFS
jgi:glutamate racemase